MAKSYTGKRDFTAKVIDLMMDLQYIIEKRLQINFELVKNDLQRNEASCYFINKDESIDDDNDNTEEMIAHDTSTFNDNDQIQNISSDVTNDQDSNNHMEEELNTKIVRNKDKMCNMLYFHTSKHVYNKTRNIYNENKVLERQIPSYYSMSKK